jgi:hypothetical protein
MTRTDQHRIGVGAAVDRDAVTAARPTPRSPARQDVPAAHNARAPGAAVVATALSAITGRYVRRRLFCPVRCLNWRARAEACG